LHAQTTIFLHIPKTAGVTLRRIIKRQYDDNEMHHGHFPTKEKTIKAFDNLPDECKSKIRMLSGHLTYGIHEQLSGNSTYFTFLREPIERTISHYYYIRSRPHEFEIAKYLIENEIEFHEALERELIPDIQNVQTRMIAGLPYDFPPNSYSDEHLETAKKNLSNHFAVIGLVEQFDTSLMLLKKTFGWNNIYYSRQNKTSRRPLQEDIPKETMVLIEKENHLDIKLYKFAQELFAKQLAQQDETFAKDLRRFQLWNQSFYSPLKTTYGKLDNLLRKAYWQMRKVSVRKMIKQKN